jgi:hypothetical protein
VGFAVPLDLGHFEKSFAKGARFSILAVYRLSRERLDDGEHAPVTEISVVRDSVPAHPLPQVAGIVAAERLLRRIRFYQAGLAPIVAKDDVAVKVVPASVRSPLVADERSEVVPITGLVRRFDDLLPRTLVGDCAWHRQNGLGNGTLSEARNDVDG